MTYLINLKWGIEGLNKNRYCTVCLRNNDKISLHFCFEEEKVITFFSLLGKLVKEMKGKKPEYKYQKIGDGRKAQVSIITSKKGALCLEYIFQMNKYWDDWILSSDFEQNIYSLVCAIKAIDLTSYSFGHFNLNLKTRYNGKNYCIRIPNTINADKEVVHIADKIHQLHDIINKNDLKKRINSMQVNAANNKVRIMEYIHEMTLQYSNVSAIHIDFGISDYASFMGVTENQLAKEKWWLYPTLLKSTSEVKIDEVAQQFIKSTKQLVRCFHQRQQGLMSNIIGYIWKVEYGVYKKFNCHMILFTDNYHAPFFKDIYMPLELVWKHLTNDVGVISFVWTIRLLGEDKEQQQKIIDNIVTDLVDIDCFYQMKIWGKQAATQRCSKVRLLGKGQI